MNHVVFADPENTAARELQADALEQLGYQAESGPWRNFYLTGAQELRQGVGTKVTTGTTASPDTIRAMPLDLFFDYLGVRLNGPKAGRQDHHHQLELHRHQGAVCPGPGKRRPEPHGQQARLQGGCHHDPDPGGVQRGHYGRPARARGQNRVPVTSSSRARKRSLGSCCPDG